MAKYPMAHLKKPNTIVLSHTVRACLDNGARLLEESYDLEFRSPPSSRFFLVMIAQEEFAKSFIIYLVREDVLPFSASILRAINDHTCKQLIGLIMDYVIMHWDEVDEMRAMLRLDHALGERLPEDIGSAMDLLRHEKIGRWESKNWVWAEEPEYHPTALNIADGKKDRHKQDSLYVRIGRDGRVCSAPDAITSEESRGELERARRYRDFVESLLVEHSRSNRLDRALGILKALFTTPSV
jgi:AbiV family abortive infection protein